MREAIHYLGYAKDFSIYDEDDVEKLLRALSKELFGQDAKVDLKRARSLISQAKNGLPGDSEEDLKKLYELYRKKMKEFNAVDFDDLLFLPVELFREVPDALAYYQTRWPYILVDEYQDTNQTQYEFVRLLAGSSQNLFVVGDPDQSIYSWRGASIRNILNFENDYPGAKLIYLEQNYRSTCTILNASNAVIEKNSNRYEKSLWSSGEEGEKIQIFQAMSEREEAAFVARKIEKLKREGQSLTSFVVFYRTNFQSRVFEDELVAKQIPYTIVGGTSFYQRREIKDILSYLRLVQSPTDHVAFLRIVNLPKRGLGEQFISKVAQAASENQIPIGSIDTLPFPLTPRQKEGWSCFRGAINKLHEIKATNSLANLVRAAIHETNYLVFIDQEEETKSERRENLAELIVKAEEWSDTHEGGQLSQFLEEIALVTSTDVLNPNEERLSLMTAHNSKGLEFDTVFLVGLEEDLFPH
ncbi:MAG TPA: 3'-5' exonuclease, partial [Chlamydiales bacterium]|nr:3'-5' exonuclease [Chlamydiales bacterium]